MRILYLAPEMVLPGTHGGSTHVLEACRSFVRLGHSVILVLRRASGQQFYEFREGITFLRFPVLSFGPFKVFSYFFISLFSTFFLLPFVSLVYERARLLGGIGCIVASFFGRRSVYEMIEPYVALPLVLGTMKKGFIHSFLRLWHTFVCRCASRVLVTHPSFCTDIPSGKELYVHTGVDVDRFTHFTRIAIRKKHHLVGKKIVLYVGSFAWWHALESVVRAAALIKRRDVVFLLIGSGEKFEDVKKLIAHYGLEDIFVCVGSVPFAVLPSYIAAADICLCLFDRTYPPFQVFDYFYSPIKIHEYKIMQKPIVASNIGNLQTLVPHGEGGLLVNEQYPQEIAEALLRLLRSPTLRQKFGSFNRRDVLRTYTWDKVNTFILDSL